MVDAVSTVMATTFMTRARPRAHPASPSLALSSLAYPLSSALAACAALVGAATFFMPQALRGPAVMNGSARGTALVMLVLGTPVLVAAMLLAARGSVRALVVWLGALAFMLYNGAMFVFATPFNSLFLLYLATLSLAVWSLVALLRALDVDELGTRFAPSFPERGIAAYAMVLAVGNAVLWLLKVVPAVLGTGRPSFLAGTGLTTNPVFVLDLGFGLPILAVSAAWLWRRRPWGFVGVGLMLTMLSLEGVCVAVDQWFGHAADPSSPVASAALVPAFAVMTLIGLIPVGFYFKNLDRRP